VNEDAVIAWWWQVVAIGLYVGSVLGIAQWLASRGIADERSRKFVHIATGNIILLAWWLAVPLWLALAFGATFCAVTLLSYRYRLLGSVGGVDRKSWGTFFYSLSITLLIAFYWPQNLQVVAAVGVLVMTWGDAVAALVGQTWGRREYKVLGMRKTVEGSLAMAVVSFAVCLLLLGFTCGWSLPTVLSALAIAGAATGLEIISVGGIDNLTVPLGSALLTQGLIQAFL
jgi:phytol kinase